VDWLAVQASLSLVFPVPGVGALDAKADLSELYVWGPSGPSGAFKLPELVSYSAPALWRVPPPQLELDRRSAEERRLEGVIRWGSFLFQLGYGRDVPLPDLCAVFDAFIRKGIVVCEVKPKCSLKQFLASGAVIPKEKGSGWLFQDFLNGRRPSAPLPLLLTSAVKQCYEEGHSGFLCASLIPLTLALIIADGGKCGELAKRLVLTTYSAHAWSFGPFLTQDIHEEELRPEEGCWFKFYKASVGLLQKALRVW
jgi:hypothetical protein